MKAELWHRVVRVFLTTVIFVLFGAMFVPFAGPILMAALFGFALDGLVSQYAIKRSKRRLPTALILLCFFLLVSLPIAVISYRILSLAQELAVTRFENTTIYHSLDSLLQTLSGFGERILRTVGAEPPEGGVMGFLPSLGPWVLAKTASLAGQAPQLLVGLFVFSAALYVFLTESRYIRKIISSFRVLDEAEIDQIIRVIQRTSYKTLVVSAGIGAIQALVVATGGLIFGHREFFLIFVVTFFTSFVPVIGAGPVAILLAILSFIQADYFSGVGLLVVALVAGSLDNIIKPLVMASASDEVVNPVISLLAIIGAVIVYGLPGLLLGPILLELTLKIVPILFSEGEAASSEKTLFEDKGH